MNSLEKDLEGAEKVGELHPSVENGLEEFKRLINNYAYLVSSRGEVEFLIHPRPYSPKDILKMQVGREYKVDERTPNLLKVFNSQDRYAHEELIGRWLHMKAGQIVKVE